MTLWRLQLEQAEKALQQFSSGNVMASLYGENLIHDPLEILRATNRFLALGLSSEQIYAIVNRDNRFVDAKNNPAVRLHPNLAGALNL